MVNFISKSRPNLDLQPIPEYLDPLEFNRPAVDYWNSKNVLSLKQLRRQIYMMNKIRSQVEDLAWRMNAKESLLILLNIIERRRIPIISGAMKSSLEKITNPLRRNVGFSPNEKLLENFMVPEPDKCFVDVGANIGWWALFVAQKGNEVHAFEPAPETYKILKEKGKNYPKLQCYQYALGDRDSTAQMGIYEKPWDGGVMSEEISGKRNNTVTVTIHTLDGLDLKNVGVIKIDTEGYETPILAGATQTILRHKPRLIIELHRGTGAAFQTYPQEFRRIACYLETIGYSWTIRYRRTSLREAQPFIIAENHEKREKPKK